MRKHKVNCKCGRVYNCKCDSARDHDIWYCRECKGDRKPTEPLLPAKPWHPIPKPWLPEINKPYQHAKGTP